MMDKRIESYIKVLGNLCIDKKGFNKETDGLLVKNISYNSKEVFPGMIFICKGTAFKAEYLEEAIKKGAICYISEKYISDKIPAIIVSDIREAISVVSGHMYNHIWNNMTEIGITGTKGKSTTAYFIKSILDCHYKETHCNKTALVSGICNYNGDTVQESKLTTPETLELHKLLFECVSNGCDTVVMEVSSQGLKYKRVEDLQYKIGVFLNIGIDHISDQEHKSFEDYFHSKLEIFKHCKIACINTDIEEKYLFKIMEAAEDNGCRIVTFGSKPCSYYRGTIIKSNIEKLVFELFYGSYITTIELAIGGGHNLTNALAAVAVCRELGVPMKYISKGLKVAKVPGRMEIYDIPGKDSKIIVDYAHNEMSYKVLFDSINKSYPEYKKLFMFGCADGRALNRRKEAGKITDKEADKVVLTQYDSGKEDANKICKEIREYISSEKDVEIILNRDDAVKYCINAARDGWIIILAGSEKDSNRVKNLLK